MLLNNIVSKLVAPYNFINQQEFLQEEIPVDYIRVKYLYCGICGGDYSRYIGYRKSYPISLGHEFVAEIIGKNISEDILLNVGDYVVSDFNYRCGTCTYCMNGKTHLCIQNDKGLFSNRAFSLYADIHYSYLVKTNIPVTKIYRATAIEPLSCIIHALNHYNINKINSIFIFGTGNIGMLCAFYLGTFLTKDVYIFDSNQQRVENIINTLNCKKGVVNKNYDLIIEATNSSSGLFNCIQSCSFNSEICSFSHLYGQETDSIYDKLVSKEISIYFPLRNGAKENLRQASDIVENLWLDNFDKLIYIHETNDINMAFKNKLSHSEPKQIIKFTVAPGTI